jgi:hypothetical protein
MPIFPIPLLGTEPAGKEALDLVGEGIAKRADRRMVSVTGMMTGRKGGGCCG